MGSRMLDLNYSYENMAKSRCDESRVHDFNSYTLHYNTEQHELKRYKP